MAYIFLFLCALIAYIIKGVAGFGNTLLMVPLFSFILPSQIISPMDLLFSIPINLFLVLRDRKSFSFKIVLPLSLLLLIGDIPGALFLKTSNDVVLKIILSFLIIGIAIEMWTRPKSNSGKMPNIFFLGFIGILSGLTAGIFGISVLLVAYISRTTSDKGAFKANLGFVFLIDNLSRLIYYPQVGLFTKEVLTNFFYFLPVVIIGNVHRG